MKKVQLKTISKLGLLALAFFALTACNKDFTCECEDVDGEQTYKFVDTSKNMAETDCDLLAVDYAANGGNCILD